MSGGIQLGHTVLYGFYGQRDDMIGAGAVLNNNILAAKRGSGAWALCRKSMLLPCPSGCNTTTSMPQ